MGVLGEFQDPSNKELYQKDIKVIRYSSNKRKNCKTIPERDDTEEVVRRVNKMTTMNKSTSGWIRIYCGPDRSDLITMEPSRMVHCSHTTTAGQIVKELNLPEEYTLWMQIGGTNAQRLTFGDRPYKIQDDFYKTLGYENLSRRSRLEIDPEIKYLLRFFIGPSEIPLCKGVTKSGIVDVLKGLVFPQWKRRCIAVIGSQLFLYPANSSVSPEVFNLSGADVIEHTPSYDRLILKIVPKIIVCENLNFYLKDNNKLNYKNSDLISVSASSVYNSSSSINSSSGEREKVLFLGFEESWERDLWSKWLLEVGLVIDMYVYLGQTFLETN